jgi:hypothetical protein
VEHLRPEESEGMKSFIAPEVGVEPTFACEHRKMSRERDEYRSWELLL